VTKQREILILLVVVVGLVCPAGAAERSGAEKLLRAAPEDILFFVATSGGDELKSGFEKTILGRMWYDPGTQQFCKSIKDSLLSAAKRQMSDPNQSEELQRMAETGKLFLSRPMIAGAARKQALQLPLYLFAIVDAGARKAEITSAVEALEAQAPPNHIVEVTIGLNRMHELRDADLPVYWGWVGDYFVFALNDPDGAAAAAVSKASYRAVPGYLADVPGTDDAIAFYLDFEKTLNTFEEALRSIVPDQSDMEGFGKLRAVLAELGLGNLKTISARAGFAGPDVVSQGVVKFSGERSGLMACYRPVQMSMFDMVDAKAVSASVFNLNAAGVYDAVMNTVKQAAGEEGLGDIDDALAEVEAEIGFGIRDGLLASLAGPVVVYELPAGAIMEAPQGGAVAIAELADANKFENALVALGNFASAESDGMLQVSTQEQDGRKIHTCTMAPLAMVGMMPTWTIVDNKAVIATNPALCNLAVKQMTSAITSIRTTEGFQKATAKLPANLLSVSYIDSKVQFNQMMTQIQQFWPMVTMMATQAGVQLPFMLPQLGHIASDMGPTVSYSWLDGNNIRSAYRGSGVEQVVGAAVGGAVGVGMMMPSLARARQVAQRVSAASNLKQIGLVLMVYANDHEGRLPSDLDTQEVLRYTEDPKLLESPRKPADFDGASFIYIAGQSTSMNPNNVVVYENPEFCDEKVNVLFLDSHVEVVDQDELLDALEETYERLGKPMQEFDWAD